MSCPIPEIIRQDLDAASKKFIGNSTTFYEARPGVIVMPTSNKFSTNQLKQIALSNSKRTNAFMAQKYPTFATEQWITQIQDVYSDKVVVLIKFPKRLESALYVKDQLMAIEDANAELLKKDLESVGEDFYMGDVQLKTQQEKELSDFDLNYLMITNNQKDC